MKKGDGLFTVVLDIEDRIRKKRIQQREHVWEADNSDRYLAENGERSERIARAVNRTDGYGW